MVQTSDTYNYPQRFQQIATDLASLYARKNNDYGNSFADTYQRFGPVSALTRMSDKFNRACQLALYPKDQKINDEGLKDTLLDLAAYSIMYAMELERENVHACEAEFARVDLDGGFYKSVVAATPLKDQVTCCDMFEGVAVSPVVNE